jgi:methylthioribose-1-phosphate isomerase
MSASYPQPIRWTEDRAGLVILDQTRLPHETVELELRSLEDVFEAIQALRVRGAPLIGITAALGVAALARASERQQDPSALRRAVGSWCDRLSGARPTAVNLAWALERMRRVAHAGPEQDSLVERLEAEAQSIWDEDRDMCRRIGEHALALLGEGASVLTHCNAGALATGGIGTALAPVYLAHERGLGVRVFADETRPLLQGSRLTAWELGRAGIDVTVISDNTSGALFQHQRPDVVLVGADRIAANGDVANKIGTYPVAVLARHHDVPFYALAPTSTIDLETPSGAEIPIEHRSADEVRRGFGSQTAPADARVWSPAFDVTPAELVTGIVTEHGVCRAPFPNALRNAVAAAVAERSSG